MNNRIFPLKRLDLVLQVTAFAVPVLWGVLTGAPWLAFCAYYTVGAAQVLSAVIHLVAGTHRHHRRRRRYEWALLGVLVAGLVTIIALMIDKIVKSDIFDGVVFLYLLAMLVTGPVMAVYYFRLCILEVRALKTATP